MAHTTRQCNLCDFQPNKAPRTTAIQQVFVGGACPGDVREASLLQKAVDTGRQCSTTPPGAPPALSCSCTVVPGCDHGVAAAMRALGELHELLTAAAGAVRVRS